ATPRVDPAVFDKFQAVQTTKESQEHMDTRPIKASTQQNASTVTLSAFSSLKSSTCSSQMHIATPHTNAT
ncbi:hypothetical protein, partial [Salmonella sp. s54925]|uniref:hypothetical protein n=1 Tax=Salmonella sp. s54925 TaxID=3159674 RepID=UPI0039800694